MSKLTDKIEVSIQDIVNELGYEIEYIEYVKERKTNIVRIVIDKLNALLNTDDMEKVSKGVEDIIDNIMPDESYVLEVSSPGIERKLKNTRLYKKYIKQKIKVQLYSKNNITGSKEIVGILNNIDNEYIYILLEDKEYKIKLNDINLAHTVYEFEGGIKNGKENE